MLERFGHRGATGGQTAQGLAMTSQRAGHHAVEHQPTLSEIVTQPSRLLMTEIGEPVVIVGAERRLRVTHEKEFRHEEVPSSLKKEAEFNRRGLLGP
jgi:hypothetical protein